MIVTHVYVADTENPARNYIIAKCDGCRAECAESRQPGKDGWSGLCKARTAALACGWSEREVADTRRRFRGNTITRLFCPSCAAKVTTIPDEGRSITS